MRSVGLDRSPSNPAYPQRGTTLQLAAQVVKRLPEGDDWTYELKFDGYRALIIKDGQRVELRSRKNKDLTGMYRGIAAAGRRLKADQAIVVDGEGGPAAAAAARCGVQMKAVALLVHWA